MVGMNHGLAGLAGFHGHIERVQDEVGGLAHVDRPADDLARVDVDDTAAVDLPLAGGMLGDVRAPQLVRSGRSEVPVDQVFGGHEMFAIHVPFAGASQPAQARAYHHPCHLVPADADAQTVHEFGVHPTGAVAAAGGAVDVRDRLGEHLVSDRALAHWPVAPRPVAAVGDA